MECTNCSPTISSPSPHQLRGNSFGPYQASSYDKRKIFMGKRYQRLVIAMRTKALGICPWHPNLAASRQKPPRPQPKSQATSCGPTLGVSKQRRQFSILQIRWPLSLDTLFGEERDYTGKRSQTSPNRACVCACERIMYDKVEIHALMMMRMRMMIILPTRTLRMIMVRMMRWRMMML